MPSHTSTMDHAAAQCRWLADALAAFDPCDEKESIDHIRMLRLLESRDNPMSRGHFSPGHFTASAFVLCPGRADLLLILHGKLHRWLQPGGHVDATDADLIAAARREVREETGLVNLSLLQPGVLDVDIHPIPPNAKKGEPAHEHFDVRFAFLADDRNAVAASDARQVRWTALEEITEELTDASVMRAVRRLRSL